MNPGEIESFVVAAAAAQGLALDAQQLQRVVTAFGRNAAIAQRVVDFDLPAAVEAAPVFTP
jgi:hypothetical protein